MSLSLSRSGAYFSIGVCSTSKSQPVWAKNMPFDEATRGIAVGPRGMGIALGVAEGVVLAVVGDPARDRALDREAAGDRRARSSAGGSALNEPWVKARWKPIVMPCAATAKNTAPIARSSHDSPQPQANGTARATASSGTATKTPTVIRSARVWRSAPVNIGALPSARAAAYACPVSDCSSASSAALRARSEVVVTGLLRGSRAVGPVSNLRLRNRNLRNRNLVKLRRTRPSTLVLDLPGLLCWQGRPHFECGYDAGSIPAPGAGSPTAPTPSACAVP